MMVCLSAAIAIQASQSVPTALGESVVGSIVFDPNRFDVMSVRRWRDEALAQGSR